MLKSQFPIFLCSPKTFQIPIILLTKVTWTQKSSDSVEKPMGKWGLWEYRAAEAPF